MSEPEERDGLPSPTPPTDPSHIQGCSSSPKGSLACDFSRPFGPFFPVPRCRPEKPQAAQHRPRPVHRGPADLPIWHTREPGRRAGPRRAGKSRSGDREASQAAQHRPRPVHRGPADLPIWHTPRPGRRAGPRRAGNPRPANRDTPKAAQHRPETVRRSPADLPIRHTREPGRRAEPSLRGIFTSVDLKGVGF